MFKSGYVGVVGKPNAGKSTLINKLVGYKVAITTPKPQTTRYNIKGIVTSETSQIVFIDTPGVHTPKHKLGEYMMKGVSNAVNETNLIVYLVDCTHTRIDEAAERVIKDIVKLNKKVILCINKIDKIKKEEILRIIEMYNNYVQKLNFEFVAIVPISVYKEDGLDILIKVIEDNLDESEALFASDEFTDMTEREIAEECIREKILNNLNEEVPHGITVEVDTFKEITNINGNLVYCIVANIICNKDTYKPMVIGKDGSMLRHITNSSKIDLEKILDTKINLKIWVKVRENWAQNENYLKNVKFRNLNK
ncbi:MAG: GTPase Era [Clostridia bacterium]|nr:GTPase Era [Clostridia bacterium]MDD4386814.1 GTPase Era [Clostridia bacterium]